MFRKSAGRRKGGVPGGGGVNAGKDFLCIKTVRSAGKDLGTADSGKGRVPRGEGGIRMGKHPMMLKREHFR